MADRENTVTLSLRTPRDIEAAAQFVAALQGEGVRFDARTQTEGGNTLTLHLGGF